MKKNGKIVIVIVLIIIILLSLWIFLGIVGEQKEADKRMAIIRSNYHLLEEKVKDYNTTRSDLAEKLNIFTCENYKEEDYDEVLLEYEREIDDISRYVNEIDKRCGVIYKESEINKICDSYEIIYEKIINLYVTDFRNYNNKISSYNENKKIEEHVKLRELVFTDFIDKNNDGVYEGVNN